MGADYYQVSYDAINWLSLMYMIVTIPFTLPSTWFIDKYGVRAGVGHLFRRDSFFKRVSNYLLDVDGYWFQFHRESISLFEHDFLLES